MKTLTLSILFLFTFLQIKAEERGVLKSQIPFSITKRYFDTGLASERSTLKITAYEGAKKVTSLFRFGYNDHELAVKSNKEGEFSQNLKSGKYVLYFYVDGYFEIITDTIEIMSQEVIEADLHLQKADVIITVDKPVIYLYPLENTKVEVKIENGGKLGFTYPAYKDGWKFTATPDGKLNFENKEYNYLFYEADITASSILTPKNIATGFLVSTDTLLNFLEKSLNQMGFTAAESADFITYWYPQMIKNENNCIRFLFNEECNVYGELKITPQPETIFRVGMIWGDASEMNSPMQNQVLPNFERKGFTVVEWGGVEVDASRYLSGAITSTQEN